MRFPIHVAHRPNEPTPVPPSTSVVCSLPQVSFGCAICFIIHLYVICFLLVFLAIFPSFKHDRSCWEPNVSEWKWQTGKLNFLNCLWSLNSINNFNSSMMQVSNVVVGVTTGKKWQWTSFRISWLIFQLNED